MGVGYKGTGHSWVRVLVWCSLSGPWVLVCLVGQGSTEGTRRAESVPSVVSDTEPERDRGKTEDQTDAEGGRRDAPDGAESKDRLQSSRYNLKGKLSQLETIRGNT